MPNPLADALAQSNVHVPLPGLAQPIGAGDVVARVTQALGIPTCSPCEQRRRWLNEHLQFDPWAGRGDDNNSDNANTGGLG